MRDLDQFILELEKILMEDSDFQFSLDLNNHRIEVSLPEAFLWLVESPDPFYIKVDWDADKARVFIIHGSEREDLGRFAFSKDAAIEVIEWLDSFLE